MPRVPVYDNPQVAPAAAPAPYDQGGAAKTILEMAGNSGRQAMQLGQALQGVGETLTREEVDAQNMANQVRVDDALNKVRQRQLDLTYNPESGYSVRRGAAALDPDQDGRALPQQYGDQLQQTINELSTGLGNDAQRRVFSEHAAGIATQFTGNVQTHMLQEYRQFGLRTQEGTIKLAADAAKLSWQNPDQIAPQIQSAQAAVWKAGQIAGEPANLTAAKIKQTTSAIHLGVIDAALTNKNPGYALEYMEARKGEMTADDLLKARGVVTKEVDNRVGMTVANEVLAKVAPQISTSDGDRAFNIALGTESGNRQFGKDGLPLTSPKGAIGIAQVMPLTGPEAAKLAGLPWDKTRYETDADYNKAIGRAYFQKQLQENGGDLSKAYAAYNAGPGALADAIKKADRSVALNKNDPTVPVKTYLDFLPKETQNYVAKNMTAYAAGGGVNAKPTFLEIDNQLRADPRLANNPQRYAIARADAEKRFEEVQKATKAREEDAVAAAMRGVIENGGRFSDLPVALRANLPPKEVDSVITFAQKISKGDDTTNPRLYDRLTNNPQELARMSDNQFFALRRELNDSDFKHFSTERAKLSGKAPGSTGPGDLNSQAIKQSLDERLRMLKIDPSPKDDGSDDAARIGGIRRFVDQYMYAAQRETGKKFTDAEVVQHLDALFAKNTTFRGLFKDSSGPMLGMKVGDLGSDVKDRIKAAYKRQGIDSPTDAQIMNTYWLSQTARK